MRKLFTSLSCLLLVAAANAQTTTSISLSDFITKKGDSLYKAGKLPGIFVGILNKGEKQFFNFGYAIPDDKLPFDSATLFEAGSITKTFTAYILTSILQQKGISDSSSIISYLPDSMQSNKALQGITFLSLLNHTSGLTRLPTNMILTADDMTPYDHYTMADLFSYLKTATPKPDGKSNYSNLGMGLAGVLAQRISGKDYPTLLRQLIFVPFSMKAPGNGNKHRKSQGYFGEKKAVYWTMNALAPAGALQSTANEMLAYLSYMSNPATEQTKTVITQLLKPTVVVTPTMQVGRAWHTFEQKNQPIIYWHNGGTYGFSTFAAFVKGTGQAVIIVVNKFNSNAVSDGLGIAIMKKMLE
ncbi:MAG: class beta-lactamase-related serine hydrolase [Flavisolibacter sp.]|jgi:CubicO group peptidase (beta-lactamase class C family)|nr:class beta-lactamase-related serine hydrolase [Flavisolibacter sp.]